MTEEIIIDGVNVAECPNYYKKDGSCMSGDCDCTLCIHNNCYYKQFKRLEQDSKQLTQWLDEARRNADFWCDKCISLEQENKDFETLAKSLYKRIEELEKENEALAFRERLYKADYEASEQENKELKSLNKKICEDSAKEIKVYWNVLEEIREKVKNPIVLSCFASAKFVLEQIENKINEVLGC